MDMLMNFSCSSLCREQDWSLERPTTPSCCGKCPVFLVSYYPEVLLLPNQLTDCTNAHMKVAINMFLFSQNLNFHNLNENENMFSCGWNCLTICIPSCLQHLNKFFPFYWFAVNMSLGELKLIILL